MGLVGWSLLGAVAGLLSYLSQQRTVMLLHPDSSRKLQQMVIGGALIRWLATAVLLALALNQSLAAGLGAFAGLWMTRWSALILLGFRPLKACSDKHSVGRS